MMTYTPEVLVNTYPKGIYFISNQNTNTLSEDENVLFPAVISKA